MEMTGLSRTDCINQAIKLYELVKMNELDGREHYSRDPHTGKIAQIIWETPKGDE